MNDFTASNGGTVETITSGRVIVRDDAPYEYPDGTTRLGQSSYLDPGQIITLREFFQAEADERLGRWRWPENPDYVVYRRDNGSVTVFEESMPTAALTFWKGVSRPGTSSGKYMDAARAYFDAHPEPKQIPNEPRTAWVDKYGTDVWHVGVDGVLRCLLSPSSNPEKYAPFTRLVPEKQS